MTKKHNLLAALCVCALSIFFAFTSPKTVRETVLTLFFPAEKPAYGQDFTQTEHEAAAAKDFTLISKEKLTFEGPDTFPPIKDRDGDFINANTKNPVDLRDPKAVEQKVEFDPVTNMYIVTEKIGNDYYRAPTYMTFDEYMRWREQKQQREYFDRLQGKAMPGEKSSSGIVDPVARLGVKKPSLVEKLFGGTEVDIKPQGNINLTFGYNYQKIENPILTLRQQATGIFDFDMDINMSAAGKIGEKLNLNFNYNTQATFDLDNQMKLQYDPKNFSKDEILQGLEAGQVSLPLRSNLIKGAQNLFGVKADLKFGHLKTTLLASQQRSRQNQLTVQGGSQLTTYERPIDEYDENRHFLLSHWNRNQFEPSLACLPVPLTNFTITRMEVWITNDRQLAGGVQPGGSSGVRDIVAFADLGEPEILGDPNFKIPNPIARDNNNKPLPENKNNALYPRILDDLKGPDSIIRRSDKVINLLRTKYGIKQIRDFEKVQAVQLSANEFTFNEQLGFVSINRSVQPDQTIGVAFEYTYNGIPYKIGEFSSDVPIGDTLNQKVLFVKMLKSTTPNVKLPIWDLMMKNVYSVGAVNVDPNEFKFDIFYEDPGKGQKRFFNADNIPTSLKARPLLQVFNMDNLNLQGDPGADGIFDFVPGVTINLRSGRVMFPVLEPFGGFLFNKLRTAGMDSLSATRLIYSQLYDSTLFRAREYQEYNRFTLRGQYKGVNNSEISLGTFNLPRGSVRVSGPGGPMVEGRDYTVDYNIGKVRILNESVLQSGQSVSVSFEDNTLFGFQQRSMIGARFDYDGFGKDINLGGTFMNVFERPLTQKVNYGDDPINNKMYGLDFSISKEAPWLTKLVDKLPFISTKEPSSISSQMEVALLQPGHNRAINFGQDEGGTVYLDDFEGSTANFRIDFPANQWAIASVPQGDEKFFPESERQDSLLGVNRARLSWYNGGETAFRTAEDANRPYTRSFQQNDLFPNRQIAPNEQPILRGLDVTMFPRERGPYNYEIPDGHPGISKGMTTDGALNDPASRWAGIMKGLNTNDFEAANIEFIEFWMLNPYMDQGDGSVESQSGDMVIDLGTISEDIMRDSRQFFENGIPVSNKGGALVNTPWGKVPVLPPVVNAFDNNNDNRAKQDVGLDGLDNNGEAAFFAKWLSIISGSSLLPDVKASIVNDPSNDDFVYFGDESRFTDQSPLFDRYKFFNNPQGNSPSNESFAGNALGNPSATNLPDAEDLNRDNSLNENESYYRYKIPLKRGSTPLPDGTSIDGLDTSSDILKDIITETQVAFVGGQKHVWYRFKLPLDLPKRQTFGGIQDFRSIRFIRMLWKGFTERTTFRFANIELGRNQWRRYSKVLGEGTGCDDKVPTGSFDVNAVNIEENSARLPFNYTIPPGITREQSVGAFPSIQQNEQALSMTVCSLTQCQARAVFKQLNMDLRQFKRVKMFAHLEGLGSDRANLGADDLKMFIRLGSDFVNNYYEFEIPLVESREDLLNGNPESPEYKQQVWRPENNFDFPLEVFTKLKQLRNDDPNFPLGELFIRDFTQIIKNDNRVNPLARVKVVGNPNLGYVKGAMVGVRNTDSVANSVKCFDLWINELRLNGFNEQGGYAGLGRVDVKLADLGNISFSGNYTSIGWGSIEQRLVQRQREEVIIYDASTTLELGKFFGQKSGIRLPLYLSYANTTRNPEYDPYDLDIKLKDKLASTPDPAKKKEIRNLAQDVTVVRGYNFTNVRKERTGGARKLPLPWNIENFSLTYAQNQTLRRTPFIQGDEQNQYKGGLDWQYGTGIKPIYPFKKLIKKDKYLKFLTEFNFNPLPNTYGFNSNMERFAQKTVYRFAGEDPGKNTYYNRRFTWDRNYDIGWDITKALRFNLDINARSLIDEPIESEANNYTVSKQERRDSIMTNFRKLGRPKLYSQTASLNYTLPFKYIPMLDFINMRASYTAGYTWTAQSLKLTDMPAGQYQNFRNERHLGNVAQNNNVRQVNGEFNFETLYNKSKYLAKINKPGKSTGSGGKGKKDSPAGRGGRDNPGGPGGIDPSGGRRGDNPKDPSGGGLTGGDQPRDKAPDKRTDREEPRRDDPKNSRDQNPSNSGITPTPADGKIGGTTNPSDPKAADGKSADTSKKDSKKDKKKEKKDDKDNKKEKKERQPSMAERIALRPLMLVRRGRFTYTENYATVLPGFTPDPRLMGLSNGFEAPGWDFAAGIQPDDKWLNNAAQKGWITHRNELNAQVTRNFSQNIDAGLTIEPITDFRVELNMVKQYTRNNTLLLKDFNPVIHPDSVDIEQRARRDMGSYTISYFALNTLFDKDVDGMFERFKNYRSIISKRRGIEAGTGNTPHDKLGNEFAKGYGRTQQEVLLPAFLAAYTDKNPNTFGLDVFKTMPALNWKLNYNGLGKVGKLKKIFSSITLQHGYNSRLTMASYNTDIFYQPNAPYTFDELNADYIARFEIPQVVISENLQPLIGIAVKAKNGLQGSFDFKKTRTLAMSFVDYQLAETRSTGFTGELGYTAKNVNIPFLTGKKGVKGKSKSKKSKSSKKKGSKTAPTPPPPAGGGKSPNDLIFKFNMTYTDDLTANHRLDQQEEAIPTRGQRQIRISPSIDYNLNRRLSLRLFADYSKSVPKTSQSFPITTLNTGVTVQFTLN